MTYKLTVYVQQRPWMRCPSLEYELYMGFGFLKNLFDDEVVDTKTEYIFLSYPERWCNIVEERSIYSRIDRLYPNLKKLEIMTQSVYIIQCTKEEDVQIVRGEEFVGIGLSQEAEAGRLWEPNLTKVIRCDTLQTFLVK